MASSILFRSQAVQTNCSRRSRCCCGRGRSSRRRSSCRRRRIVLCWHHAAAASTGAAAAAAACGAACRARCTGSCGRPGGGGPGRAAGPFTAAATAAIAMQAARRVGRRQVWAGLGKGQRRRRSQGGSGLREAPRLCAEAQHTLRSELRPCFCAHPLSSEPEGYPLLHAVRTSHKLQSSKAGPSYGCHSVLLDLIGQCSLPMLHWQGDWQVHWGEVADSAVALQGGFC